MRLIVAEALCKSISPSHCSRLVPERMLSLHDLRPQSLQRVGRCASAVRADVGVADLLAEGAFGPGLPQPTPAGTAIERLHGFRPRRLAGGCGGRAEIRSANIATPAATPGYTDRALRG